MSLQPERIAQLCELLKLPAIHAEGPASDLVSPCSR